MYNEFATNLSLFLYLSVSLYLRISAFLHSLLLVAILLHTHTIIMHRARGTRAQSGFGARINEQGARMQPGVRRQRITTTTTIKRGFYHHHQGQASRSSLAGFMGAPTFKVHSRGAAPAARCRIAHTFAANKQIVNNNKHTRTERSQLVIG